LLWSHAETAELTMRQFSPAFVSGYLARCGPGICNSVGAYEIESLGLQLFERITGDYFAILGLPLLPLLGELRARGLLEV
jgi:septum formation protein